MSLPKSEVRAIFDSLSNGNGHLPPNKLCSMLAKLNLPRDSRSMVQVQGNLRYLNNGDKILDSEGGGIDFPLFWRWYKLETTPGIYEHNNELLVRRVIEHPKLPTRNLKEGSFVYGRRNVADKEGAGEVLLNWVAGERSKSKEAGISLIKVNKEAVKQKHTTSKQLNKFLREHKNDKNLQRPKILGKKKDQRNKMRQAIGDQAKPSKPIRPVEEENFTEILFPARRDPNLGRMERPYVDTSGQRVKGKLPFPRQTKCSSLQKTYTKSKQDTQIVEAQRKLWKMKKFHAVEKRTVLPREFKPESKIEDAAQESKLCDQEQMESKTEDNEQPIAATAS